MVYTCSAFGCSERFVKGGEHTFHVFPRDPIRRQRWVNATRRANFNPTTYSALCSRHFTASSFDTLKFGGVRWLKADAVPTVFEFPPHISELRTRPRISKCPATKRPPGRPRGKKTVTDDKPEVPKKKPKELRLWDDFTEQGEFRKKVKVLRDWYDIPVDPVPEEPSLPPTNNCLAQPQLTHKSMMKPEPTHNFPVQLEPMVQPIPTPNLVVKLEPTEASGVDPATPREPATAEVPRTSRAGKSPAVDRDKPNRLRYCGDITEEDFKCPVRAVAAWRVASKQMAKQSKKINTLQHVNVRLRRRIETLKSILSHLETYHM